MHMSERPDQFSSTKRAQASIRNLRSSIAGMSPFEISVEDGSSLVPSFFSFKTLSRIVSAPRLIFDRSACSRGLVPNAPKASVILSRLTAGLKRVKQHFLYFFPLPQGQRSFLPILAIYDNRPLKFELLAGLAKIQYPQSPKDAQ